MLLWINGPFGGGKTQTAHEIQRRLPGSDLTLARELRDYRRFSAVVVGRPARGRLRQTLARRLRPRAL